MATTLAEPVAASSELAYASFAIEKFEKTEDGDIYVLGKASDDSVDSDEQIVDSKWMQKAVQDWLSTGANLRVQHNSQRDPAGVGVEAYTENDGSTWVKSLVIEPVAKTLVEKGVLRAYSVGIARPKIMRDSTARGGRIVGGELCEISLVDRPANKNCGIQLVKSAADGTAEYVGTVFGDTSLGSETVSVDLPKDVSVAFSPTDLAKLLKHRAIAEERVASGELAEKGGMDPDVGGGVDRDKIPAADFAGRDRSFPIVTPGDVSDAASSIGRAGPDNFSSDQLKKNIIRIAKRKGDAFVAELPDSWKKELGMEKTDDPDTVKKKKGKKKPAFPGASKPFGSKEDDGEEDKKDDEAKPDTTKSVKGCPKCGADFHADSKLRRCSECNAKLPKADKASESDVEKKIKSVCQKCGAMSDAKHHFCPECGNSKADALPLKKNHDFMCLGCSNKLDKGEKFCPGCGKQNPGYLPMADAKLKSHKPTPTDAVSVVGHGADSAEPVPDHREPDGEFVEAFEHDAHLPTDPDGRYLKTAERLKSVGAPNDLGALHDHLCAAFHPQDVAKCYAENPLATLDANAWQQKALDAAASAPLDEARHMAQLWQHAMGLKNLDPEILAEARDDLHKEFKDANKGPGTFPTPTELSPTRFKRPYLSAGHANPGPGHSGPNTHSVPVGNVNAGMFNRDFIATGHSEDSPANKNVTSNSVIEPAPLPPGMSRTYYRNAMRDKAKEAMSAMHDHIANTFPDLCPMEGPGVGGEAVEGARPVPTPASMGKSDQEIAVEKAEKALQKLNKARIAAGLAPISEEPVAPVEKSVVLDTETIEAVIAKATAPLLEKLEKTQEKLQEAEERINALAELPDPREAAFKGLALKNSEINKSINAMPVAPRTVAENAERAQFDLMRALYHEARNNEDPAQREAAWARFNQMNGLA